MPHPDIHLHIDQLILDGLTLSCCERALLQASFEAELTRLLMEGGIGERWQAGGAVSSLAAPAVVAGAAPDPGAIGRQAAQSVYASLGGGHG